MAKKIPKKKLEKAVRGMAAKAQELGWSAAMPGAEVRAAMDEPKFVYALMDRTWGPWKKKGAGNDGGFVLRWGVEKVGFGEITFCIKKGKVVCDTECMGAKFVKSALDHFLRTGVEYDPK